MGGCKHPADGLAVVREQTVSRIDDDFEKVTYHLLCQKCGEACDITHAKTIHGVEKFLNSKPPNS